MAVATARPPLLQPGLKPLDPAFEVFWVRPGGATVVPLHADDRVTIVDPDGGQVAELTVLSSRRARGRGGAGGPRRRARERPARPAGRAGRQRLPGRAARPRPGARTTPRARACSPPRRRRARPRPSAPSARRSLVVGRPGRAGGRRLAAGLRAARRGAPRGAAPDARARAARAAGRAAAGPPRRPRDGAQLRGPQGRVHPGARRPGPPVLGLPRLPPRQAPAWARARPGLHDHAHADGQRLPDARAAREVLRPGHGPAGGGRARHRRAPRHVRPGLHLEVLRGRRLPGPRQLHGELQPRPDRLRDRASARLAGAELLLQHELRRRPHPARRRAVVAPGRLRAAAGDERPRLLLVRLPGRHRPRQRLGVHRRPCPRLRAGEPLLHGDRAPRDRRRRGRR